jgi:hypothetical protein
MQHRPEQLSCRFSSIALLGTALLGAVVAQDPSHPAVVFSADLIVPLHDVADSANGSELWAAASDYKASFHYGIRFIPWPSRGAAAKSWRWRTVVPAVAHADSDSAPPTPIRIDDRRVAYEHPQYRECYEVRANGIEQTFVIEQPIDGEFEIVGAIESELQAEDREFTHAPIRFTGGESCLDYGAAFAIDGAGRVVPLETAYRAGRIHIRVSHALLTNATFPLLIDPLIEAVVLDSSTAPLTAMAVEVDRTGTGRNTAIAFSRTFAATDDDVFLFLAESNFASRSLVFSRVTTANETEPDVALVVPADRWIVAYTRDAGTSSGEQVWLHHHALGSLAFSSTVASLASPSGGRQRRPSVGGCDFGSNSANSVVIVREVEPANTSGETNATAIWASILDPVAGAVAHYEIGTTHLQDLSRPSVSRSHDGRSWMVAWQRLPRFGAVRQGVIATHLKVDGTRDVGGFFTDREPLAEHKLAPIVDGRAGRYLIAFAVVADVGGIPPSDDRGESNWVQRFDWPIAGSTPTRTWPSQRIATVSGGRYWRIDDVAADFATGSHFAVAHSIDSPIGRYPSLTVVGFRGVPIASHALGFAGGLPSGVAFDAVNRRFAVAYGQAVTVGGSVEQQIHARAWVYPALSPPSEYGSGCGPSLIHASEQRFLIGNEWPSIDVERVAPQVPVWLLVGLRSTDLPLDPYGLFGCRLLIAPVNGSFLAVLPTMSSVSGTASIEFPLIETLPSIDLHFQWLYADPGAGWRMSNAVAVAIR